MTYNLDEAVETKFLKKAFSAKKPPSPHKPMLFVKFWISENKTLLNSIQDLYK